MSVSAADLLNHATDVLSSAACEASYRTSIGRAYYAAMHQCRSFHNSLKDPGTAQKKRMGSHAKLIQQLLHPTIKDKIKKEKSIKMGLDLKEMKAMRTIADYELGEAVTRFDAEDTVEYAEIIFEWP